MLQPQVGCNNDGLDNAVVERCFGRFKGEGTSPCHDATRREAQDDVVDDVETFETSPRLHASLGYVSPHHFARLAKAA